MTQALYNEWDSYAAEWLRNLIAAGQIAPGVVDSRSIRDVRPVDLHGFDRVHFFAGIAGWDLALQLAGWPDNLPAWTGSCPCQPFSAAGRRGGFDDDRHLWPEMFRLVAECRPGFVMGEQVASRDGLAWLDLVHADLEGAGYTVRAADLCAAGVGAPHIRQRLWWVGVADAASSRRSDTEDAGADRSHSSPLSGRGQRQPRVREPERTCAACSLADSLGPGLERRDARSLGNEREAAERGSAAGRMADAHGRHASAEGLQRGGEHGQQSQDGGVGFWSDLEWLPCRDGKARPTRPGLFPLAHGIPARVGRLRAAGNAISPEVGAAFASSVMAEFGITPSLTTRRLAVQATQLPSSEQDPTHA